MEQQKIVRILSQMSRVMEQNKEFLTELDNVIADGDHGINMARGFAAAEQKLPTLENADLGTLFKTVGMTLVSVVAGSSGPLYGTAFMRCAMVVGGKKEMDIHDFVACLSAAVDGVMMRGKAVQGEKTMLDAMIPARDAIQSAVHDGKSPKEALSAGVAAAKEGVEFTKTIAATKGRASYIGERSIGHQDPGATSFTLLLAVVADAL